MFGRKGNPDLPPLPRALQAMGPAYVKFGQVLSTRPDLTGEVLHAQLRLLQDRLTPFAERSKPAGRSRTRAWCRLTWDLIGDLGGAGGRCLDRAGPSGDLEADRP